MAVCWWLLTGGLFFFAWGLEANLAEGGAFDDFQCVPNDRAEGGYQYISLSLTFPCDGAVTKWKIGTENQEKEQVYLQIWRSTGTGYMRAAETVYSHSGVATISEVCTNMTVSAGDVIGFFIPRLGGQGLRVAWVPVPDHTLLRGMMRSTEGESPVATFSGSATTLSTSPLVSVIFEPSLPSCATTIPVSDGNGCLSAFADFNLVCGERVTANTQYIIPELNFFCDGTVTQWKVGLEGGGSGQSVNLQIWRSVGAGEYTSVTEVVYTKTIADERIASVPVSMSVMAGDMVGFYVPGVQLEPHTLPDVGLTMYTTGGSPASSLSSLSSVVGPSPYISVVFVPDVMSSSIPTTVATSVSHSSTALSLLASTDVTSSSILSMTLAASPSPMTTVAAIPTTVVTSVSPSNAASSHLASPDVTSSSILSVPDVTRRSVMTVTVADTLSSGTPIGVVPAATSMSETTAVDSSTSGSMYPPSKLPPATVGGGPSTQVSGAIIGAVVAAVAVLVVGSVVAASLIAWRVRSTKAATGEHLSPPEVSTIVTVQDNPSYSTVNEYSLDQKLGLTEIRPYFSFTSTDVTMQANTSYNAVEGVTLEPNPCYSAVKATSTYEPITGHAPSCEYDYIWPSQAQ